MYRLTDDEMNDLWTLNRDATMFFALTASALSFAFGLWMEPSPAIGAAASGEAREVLLEIGVPFFTLVATLLAGLGYLTIRRRRRALKEIARRSQAIEPGFVRTETTDIGIVSAAREPARSLLRW